MRIGQCYVFTVHYPIGIWETPYFIGAIFQLQLLFSGIQDIKMLEPDILQGQTTKASFYVSETGTLDSRTIHQLLGNVNVIAHFFSNGIEIGIRVAFRFPVHLSPPITINREINFRESCLRESNWRKFLTRLPKNLQYRGLQNKIAKTHAQTFNSLNYLKR